MKVYISGSITNGGTDYSQRGIIEKHFKAVEQQLILNHGWECVNPFDIPKQSLTWRDCLEADIKILVTCDAIYMLEGWELSKGCMLEFHIARELGLKIMFEK